MKYYLYYAFDGAGHLVRKRDDCEQYEYYGNVWWQDKPQDEWITISIYEHNLSRLIEITEDDAFIRLLG